MKKIEIDDELYQYIASNTQSIGESASQILRRLLNLSQSESLPPIAEPVETIIQDDVLPEQQPQAVVPYKGNVFNILNKEELAMQKGAVGRFLFILAAFYRTHKKDFKIVLDIKGRDRVYFASSKEELLEGGNSMNPKNIPDSTYWVMTNSNTTRKKMMLHEVAISLGYTNEQAEIIRDYL
ncbi:replication initiation negative regulator SeqA [Pseudoalteromonas tunicata]|jgi:negative modulator of initiation of replication|uniref:Negative modulator of initiation of replication n=1 Tax=Pseudoalteromonas tunicata D2 TaxID=87626 RepID=A4CCC2_9GAMM|nr:replication initiation negative regulator SeqA [Pseudoalteromonas tunicata]ATC94557.1 negative modulator of initiation of replication [Pseudoalteromonas tunicata]AXT30284.1 replication initiation negative regulator SeqA [Pseudoalteromonas tunicata]EAR28009.1 SeqA protein [Pseudoalteromonas tunicata D2]MDP4982157.1 replication initiation negative regulator SeqA [Pseudoalteromonas tunicata]MDP5212141.1 replication initiation negative regulator SeqA [Pseudoalteromonas tunicata]